MNNGQMIPTVAEGEHPGPYAALAAKARRSSDGALAAESAVGALLFLALLAWRPSWWQFVLAPLAIGAFGLWGIADRELADATTTTRRRALVAARWITAALGTILVLVSAFRIVGAVVGRVIS